MRCLDADAFGSLFRSHFSPIYGYLARRVGADLASELASEVFAVAYTRRASFDPSRGEAHLWLFGIATNLLWNHRRTETRQLRAFARTGVDPVAQDRTDDVDRRLDAERLGPAIARALAALRDDDRDVLLLYAWASLSYREIAAALDVPIGTVRSRLSRARRKLREHLDPFGQVPAVMAEQGEAR